MTDEENNINSTTTTTTTTTNNKNNNNNTTIINNERIIAEAAKILLKNGINGSNLAAAAAATLLSAKTFQLPALPRSQTAAIRGKSALQTYPPAAIVSIPATSNGLSLSTKLSKITKPTETKTPPTTTKTTTTSNMAAVTAASATSRLGAATPPMTQISLGDVKGEMSVIDYTISAVNNNQKATASNDIGRHPISSNTGGGSVGGGRLQFYKDGKFILELARSKDGEKGGWVSVPRKLFRSPSTTSSTVTPSSAISTAYPKNESSTSLSFSDDNSSIQSSPWQRDHCWKQLTPRRGLSKEMSLVFWIPKRIPRTAVARRAAHRRRRRPLDPIEFSTAIFERIIGSEAKSDSNVLPNINELERSETNTANKDSTMGTKNGISGEEDGSSSSSSTATLTGNFEGTSVHASRKTPTTPPSPKEPAIDLKIVKTESNSVAQEDNSTLIEKMNTSENDDDEDDQGATTKPIAMIKVELNGASDMHEEVLAAETKLSSFVEIKIEKEGEEKRLKKIKIRAKLSSIIQKLINRMPARSIPITKATMLGCNNSGALSNSNNSLAQKIFPPASAAGASRLVEYHHPQHVSPRKRILREFEKVSLEDNAAVAGGKRSRAKGNGTTSTSQFRNTKSPPNRVQSSGCTVPMAAAAATALNASEEHSNDKYCSTSAKVEKHKSLTTAAPTRLNSSYSIHSLLGGSSSNSTASSVSSAKQSGAEQAVVSTMSSFHNQQQQQQQQLLPHYTDPSYLRAMLASPKSPEGKSPSNYSASKRSPSYSSPMHEAHSRSPTVAHNSLDYGRRSPRETTPEHAVSYKMRFTADHSLSPNTAHSQHSHHLQQHQGFYSPYMMSPKYVPAPSTSISPNSNATGIARSTRHPTAFNATHSSSSASASASSSSAHIPNTFSSASSVGLIAHRELSPPRSSTASPRESTPRTVPKKTASIRRRFASPTASSTNSSCTSPCDRTNEEVVAQQDRKTPSHHMFHRSSPSTSIGPSPYYMYQPQANGATTSAPSMTAAAAYIPSVVSPSYYHPYIATLAALRQNPLWMHHYSSTGPAMLPTHHAVNAASANARLTPPFHSFPYNGVGASAAFQSPIPQATHLSHHPHVFAQPPSALHGGLGLITTGRAQFPKLTDNTDHYTTTGTATTNTNTAKKAVSTSTTIFHCSPKDEQSSDVPLNLSKH